MRIALDALPLVSSRMTGIGYCEAGQVQAMMMLHPEEQYVLQFFDKGDGVEKRKRLYYYEQQRNVSVRQGHFSGYLYRLMTTAIPLPYIFWKRCGYYTLFQLYHSAGSCWKANCNRT